MTQSPIAGLGDGKEPWAKNQGQLEKVRNSSLGTLEET